MSERVGVGVRRGLSWGSVAVVLDLPQSDPIMGPQAGDPSCARTRGELIELMFAWDFAVSSRKQQPLGERKLALSVLIWERRPLRFLRLRPSPPRALQWLGLEAWLVWTVPRRSVAWHRGFCHGSLESSFPRPSRFPFSVTSLACVIAALAANWSSHVCVPILSLYCDE